MQNCINDKCCQLIPTDATFCPHCRVIQPATGRTAHLGNRYAALRAIAWWCDFISVLVVITSVIGVLGGAICLGLWDGVLSELTCILLVIASIIGGVTGYLLWTGAAKLILLFIDIEENTRQTAINTQTPL